MGLCPAMPLRLSPWPRGKSYQTPGTCQYVAARLGPRRPRLAAGARLWLPFRVQATVLGAIAFVVAWPRRWQGPGPDGERMSSGADYLNAKMQVSQVNRNSSAQRVCSIMRPQQDSNLRTRLRSAYLFISLTSGNSVPDRCWDAPGSRAAWRVTGGRSSGGSRDHQDQRVAGQGSTMCAPGRPSSTRPQGAEPPCRAAWLMSYSATAHWSQAHHAALVSGQFTRCEQQDGIACLQNTANLFHRLD